MPKATTRWQVLFLILILIHVSGCANLKLDKLTSIFGDSNELPEIKSRLVVSEIWSQQIAEDFSDTYLKFTPVINKNNIYVCAASGEVIALSKKTGKLVWQKNIQFPISAGIGGDNNILVVGGQNGELTAFSLATKITWKHKLDGSITAISKAHQGIIIVRTAKLVIAFDVENGEVKWRKKVNLSPLTIEGTSIPLFYKEWAFIGLDNGELLILSLNDGKTVRSIRLGIDTGATDLDRIVDIDGQMSLRAGMLYATAYQGQTVAINLREGRIIWALSVSSQAGLVADKEKIFITTTDNRLVAVDKDSGEELWTEAFDWQPHLSTPVILNRFVLVDDDQGNIYWLSKKTGNILEHSDFYSSSISNMKAVGNNLFIWYREGRLTSVKVNGYRK